MSDSYDTMLSDHVSLSSGQKQLITIARAMIRNAPMLTLDEATSSVDTRTETLIQNAMDQNFILWEVDTLEKRIGFCVLFVGVSSGIARK